MPHQVEDVDQSQDARENLNGDLSSCPAHYMWVLENKDKILALHSSSTESKVFCMECSSCDRWYKHCMFSNKERKDDYPRCRWCQVECRQTSAFQFEIQMHIHCNRPGKKVCGKNCTMIPGIEVYEKEAGIEDVAGPDVQFVVKKKMSQKERKAAQRAGASVLGL